MAVLPICKYGNGVLRKRTESVDVIDQELQQLIDDMVDTMYAAPGVGLAANQVGVSKRLMIIDLSVGKDPSGLRVFINPEIMEMSGEITEEEGCLSIPDFVETVTRSGRLRVRYLDREGSEQEMEAEGLMARAVCHEVDHLNGALFIDYLRGLRKEKILKRINKILQRGGW